MVRRGALFGKVDAVEVVPGLYIGAAPDRRSTSALVRAGVSHVLDVRADVAQGRGSWPADVSVENCGLVEYAAPTAETLAAIADKIAGLMASGTTVLVHCREGIQRAPMVACAALMATGWSLADAFRIVSARRPITAMSAAQLQVLRELETLYRARLPLGTAEGLG
jgi:protein-tyrosine phosphatase